MRVRPVDVDPPPARSAIESLVAVRIAAPEALDRVAPRREAERRAAAPESLDLVAGPYVDALVDVVDERHAAGARLRLPGDVELGLFAAARGQEHHRGKQPTPHACTP